MTDKPTTSTNAPLYANLFASMVPIAREHGYALAVHGSVKRDLDLIAVPWVEKPSPPQALVDAFTTAFYFVHVDGPEQKVHGRQVWTLAFPGTCFVDLSVMRAQPAGWVDFLKASPPLDMAAVRKDMDEMPFLEALEELAAATPDPEPYTVLVPASQEWRLKFKVTGYNIPNPLDVRELKFGTSVGIVAVTDEGEFRLRDLGVSLYRFTGDTDKAGNEIYQRY